MADHVTGEQRYAELLGDLEKLDGLMRTDLVRSMLRDLRGCMMADSDDRAREDWIRGWDTAMLGRQAELERIGQLAAQVAVAALGKDRADGEILLKVYPDPNIYDWTP